MFLNKKNQKGFTLTELIVVIVIIAILAGVMLPTLTSYIARANKSADEQKVAGINTLLYEAQITEMEFEDALELKDFLENDMGYDGDYSLKLKGSYMWYDLKEGKVVIITEDDEELEVVKLAATDKAEFVTAGSLKSPEGLMQYSDTTEVWLIGGNGYLVELVEEIRNIGDNGAGNLEQFNSLKNETVKVVFEKFFEEFAFSGEEGMFEVVDGVATKVQTTAKPTVKTNSKLSLAELFHKEVIEANIEKINDQLKADSAPVSLTLDGYNVSITIDADGNGLLHAADSVYQIIDLLTENNCEFGYVFPKKYNSITEYEDVLEYIVDGYNKYQDGSQSNTITKGLYDKIKSFHPEKFEINLSDLSKFYKVNLTEFSSFDVNDPESLSKFLLPIIVALYLDETTLDSKVVYDFKEPGIDKNLFKDKDPIRLIGIINSDKYGRLNIQYDFEFIYK